MAQYVILEHHHNGVHWDFMLESGDALRTWRLAAAPVGSARISAERIGDHRVAYLDYEGPISGGRGWVRQWDSGVFEWVEDSADRVVVALTGKRLQGQVAIAAGEWSLLSR